MLIKEEISIDGHTWFLSIGLTNKVGISLKKIIPNDEDPNLWDDWDGEWSPYLVSYSSELFPEGVNKFRVIRNILHRVKSMINRNKLNDFSFTVDNERQSQFFHDLIRHYITGKYKKWNIQVVDIHSAGESKQRLYFYRINPIEVAHQQSH